LVLTTADWTVVRVSELNRDIKGPDEVTALLDRATAGLGTAYRDQASEDPLRVGKTAVTQMV
jgi:hypothetical protein